MSYKVLVWNPDGIIGEEQRQALEMGGYKAQWAEKINNGLQILSQEKPDIVICDYGCFGEGRKFVDKVRDDTKYNDVPIIGMGFNNSNGLLYSLKKPFPHDLARYMGLVFRRLERRKSKNQE